MTNSNEAMLFIMSRNDQSVPCIFLIDVDQHWNLFEKICQSIQYNPLLHVVPIGM